MNITLSDYALSDPEKRDSELMRLAKDSFSTEPALKLMAERAEKGLWDYERRIVATFFAPRGTVLCVGCGSGRESIGLSELGYEVTGIDVSDRQIKNARVHAKRENREIEFRVCDGLTLPFANEAFDHIVLWTQVIGNVPSASNRLLLMRECRRALKRDGILSFTAHNRSVCEKQQAENGWALTKNELGDVTLDDGDVIFRAEKYYYHLFTAEEMGELIDEVPLTRLMLCSASDLQENAVDEVLAAVCKHSEQ